MHIKERLLEEIKSILKNETIKNEFINLFQPIINTILNNIYPYIYLSLIFVIISFLLILGNFILFIRFFYIKNK
jgi:hypothetical protein